MKHRQRLLPSQIVMRVPDDFVEVVSEVASQEAMSTAAFIRCAVMDALKQRGITPAFGRTDQRTTA